MKITENKEISLKLEERVVKQLQVLIEMDKNVYKNISSIINSAYRMMLASKAEEAFDNNYWNDFVCLTMSKRDWAEFNSYYDITVKSPYQYFIVHRVYNYAAMYFVNDDGYIIEKKFYYTCGVINNMLTVFDREFIDISTDMADAV